MKHLEIKKINKSYNKVKALTDITLDINKGEFLCILGPSGCGKSTLLRVLAGLEDIESGEIYISGRDVTTYSPAKRNFGIVFQSYALFPNMTVRENIAYGLSTKKFNKSEIDNKVNEVIELVNLKEHSHKYPQELSGGQQQRVALARAVVLKPEFLLLDEPLSALDAKVREKLRYELKSLQQKLGITTIMVTHDQEEALSMADKVVVMNNSVIEQIGTPEEIYEKPATNFVANFIGAVTFINDNKAIRPENIVLSNQENALGGNITNIEYRGAFYRLTINSIMGEVTIDIKSDIQKKLRMIAGSPIKFHINNDDVILLGNVS